MIRSQLDTSIYQRTQSGRSTIGELLGAVQGVSNLMDSFHARTQARQDEGDARYINDVFGRNFAGWDGSDTMDLMARQQRAAEEILKTRPELYSKVASQVTAGRTAAQGMQEKALDLQGKGLDNQTKSLTFQKNLLENMKWQQDRIGEQLALVAEGKQPYGDAVQHVKALGINANLPTEEQFNQNPGQFYDYLLAHKMKNDEALQTLTQKEKELGVQKSENELAWADRLNTAKVGALNRSGTGGVLGDNGTVDDLAAYQLAVRIGGMRNAKILYPMVVKRLQEGATVDNIQDELRYAQQSTDFTGAAREGMQQLYAGHSGKAVDTAFDSFDDLLAKGDNKAISSFLQRSAENQAGAAEAQQIRGTRRTLDFVNEIQNDLDSFEANGGNTNIFSGTIEDISKKIGLVRNPKMRKVAEKIHAAIMKYRRSMSGAAFSVPESKEYSDLFPSIKRVGALNSVSLAALRDVFSGDLENFYRASMGDNAYNTYVAPAIAGKENVRAAGKGETAPAANGPTSTLSFDDLWKQGGGK